MAGNVPGPPKGSPKTPGSGRKKGDKNKRTRALEALLDDYEMEPVEFLMKVVNNVLPDKNGKLTEIPITMRIDAAKSLSPYFRPRKPVETHVVQQKPVALTINIGEPAKKDV